MSANALDRLTIADAMSWKFLQTYVGRSVSIFIGARPNEVVLEFKTTLEAEQFAKFIKGQPSVTDSLPAFAHEKDRSQQGGSSQ